MRRIPLHELRKEIQVEAGLSSEEGATAYSKDRLNMVINRTERMMKTRDDWPTQKYEIYGATTADAKLIDIPEGVSIKNIRNIDVLFGQEWLPLSKGIGPRERSVYTDTMRATPAQRWDYLSSEPEKIEIWPIGSSAQSLMFRGQLDVGQMVEESDLCTLDADVIVLMVAAEILGRDKQEDAAYKSQLAAEATQNILKDMNAGTPAAKLSYKRGRSVRPFIDYIPPGGS